jgi:hypothetical protein
MSIIWRKVPTWENINFFTFLGIIRNLKLVLGTSSINVHHIRNLKLVPKIPQLFFNKIISWLEGMGQNAKKSLLWTKNLRLVIQNRLISPVWYTRWIWDKMEVFFYDTQVWYTMMPRWALLSQASFGAVVRSPVEFLLEYWSCFWHQYESLWTIGLTKMDG